MSGRGFGASVQPSARARLSPDAALRRFCLVEVEGRGASAILSLDERIAALIQGQDFVDPRLAGLFRIVPSMPVTSDLHALSEALSPKIAIAPRPSAVLVGPKRSGRRAVQGIVHCSKSGNCRASHSRALTGRNTHVHGELPAVGAVLGQVLQA